MSKENTEPDLNSFLQQELILPSTATVLQQFLFKQVKNALIDPEFITTRVEKYELNESNGQISDQEWYSIVRDEDILSIFPKYYQIFPQSFGRNYIQNTLVIDVVKDFLDYLKNGPVIYILQQGIDKFKIMFPTLPSIEVGYAISLGKALPHKPIQLDRGGYRTVSLNSGIKTGKISYFLPKEIIADLTGNETNHTYSFANQRLPNNKMIPAIIEVVGVHEYTHGLLENICEFDFSLGGPESLASAVAEAFTVLAERVYAIRQRSAAEKLGDHQAFSSFDFILQSRDRVLTKRKNDIYSYGYLIIIKALQRQFKQNRIIFTQEDFITVATQFLKSLDLEKISQIHIHSHEARQIATNPITELPYK